MRDETGVLGQAMDRLAHNDRLTGLFNRSEVLSRLHQAIQRTTAQHRYGALLLVNLDNVSVLNNTRGHDAGDQLLIATAKRLQQLEDSGALVARLGGDEFALVLNAVDSPDAAMEMAHKVLAALVAPIGLDNGQHVLIGASIGVALFQGPAVEALSALMDRADRALYASKRGGKGLATLADAPGGAAAQPG